MPRWLTKASRTGTSAVRRVRRLPWVRGAIVGFLSALAAAGISRHPFLKAMDDWAIDTCFILRGTRPYDCPITVIGIDRQTLDELEKPLNLLSPEFAEIVTYLGENRVAAIGFDVLLSEELEGDLDLEPGQRGDAELMSEAVGNLERVVLPVLSVPQADGQSRLMMPVFQWMSKRMFNPAWTDLGVVNLVPDHDRFIREYDTTADLSSEAGYATLPFCLTAIALGLDRQMLSQRIPDSTDGRLRINFVGPPGSIPTVSFEDVLREAREQQDRKSNRWTNRIVIIGATAASLADLQETPFSNASVLSEIGIFGQSSSGQRMAGAEIHANITAMIHDEAYLDTLSFSAQAICLFLTGMLLGALMIQFGVEASFLIAVIHHIAWRIVAYLSFTNGNLILPIVPVLICGTLAFTVTFALRWRFIRRTMGMFKSEAVAREIELNPSRLSRQGENREVTILFSDIRNFTAYSEGRSPNDVVQLLNAYFAQVVPVIEKEKGILNQYIGDGMMAIFGSPVRCKDHAYRGVKTALDMLRRVKANDDVWKGLGAQDFKIGIGLCTGQVVVGTIGSPKRLDYTAIGDTVNTASRIESATKELGTEILISLSTFQQLTTQQREALNANFSEPVLHRVKGKQTAIEVVKVTSH